MVGLGIILPESEVLSEVERQIHSSRGLIAIATPRVTDVSMQVRYTLEWLHDESAIAYAKNKPILKNRRGEECRPQKQLEFDPLDLYDLKAKIDLIMPRFRAAIEQNDTKEFYETLGNLVLKGLAAFIVFALIGIIGSIADDRS
jgi:hypothetical protein